MFHWSLNSPILFSYDLWKKNLNAHKKFDTWKVNELDQLLNLNYDFTLIIIVLYHAVWLLKFKNHSLVYSGIINLDMFFNVKRCLQFELQYTNGLNISYKRTYFLDVKLGATRRIVSQHTIHDLLLYFLTCYKRENILLHKKTW